MKKMLVVLVSMLLMVSVFGQVVNANYSSKAEKHIYHVIDEFEDLGVTVVIVNEDFFADGTHVFTINVIEYDADITFEYDSNEDLQKITIDTLEMKEVIRPMLCEVEW